MKDEYLFDKEWYKVKSMTENNNYVAGIKNENGIVYAVETINEDIKKCIETQLKLMRKHNITLPLYINICRYDSISNMYMIDSNTPAIEVKYCANCYRQIDSDDLDNIEIIDNMCFHKKDC